MNQDETTSIEKQETIPARPGRGTMILVLGILSIVLTVMCCALLGPALGIPAWTMGQRDERGIQKGLIHPSERSLTRAGKICGIFGTFFGIGLLILAILIPLIVLSFLCLVGVSIASCCGL
jgi:hypothetical protein